MAKGKKTGGRVAGTPNKSTLEIRELAKKHGPAAIRTAVSLMMSADSDATRLAALKEILDRGYGKVSQPQAVNLSGNVGTYDLSKLDDDGLARLESILTTIAVTGRGSESPDVRRDGASDAKNRP